MVHRLSWVAGIGGILLALFRLERLLRPAAEGVPWQVVLVFAAVLGAAITWAGTAYRLDGRLILLLNAAAAVVTVVRVAVPSTTWLVFPTPASFGELRLELEFAGEVIRAGVAPVAPLAGVIAILVVLFWALGALLTWGLATGRPYLAVLAPLGVYLQFATMDRDPSGWWMWLFLPFLGAALLAVALDERRRGTGVLTSPITRLPVPRSRSAAAVAALAAAALIGAAATSAAAGLVPRTGVLEWRAHRGLSGEYYGGISYNPFVGIRQGLVSSTNTPVFVASVTGEVDPSTLYWRLLTLESFNGVQWYTGDPRLTDPAEVDRYEPAGEAFRGPTAEADQQVTVLALEMGWLPAAYAPVRLTADNPSVERGFLLKDDASLRFDAISYRGMTYTVSSRVPVPDLGVLSASPGGGLSPVFRAAAEDGAFPTGPPTSDASAAAPLPEPGRYLGLPDDLDPGVAALAAEQADAMETDFERALALERFLRSAGGFSYSTAIAPGHGAADLAAWLLDPASPSYRTGYCEQFAASMAVMARTLGIPSRVVLGFTPGTLLDDGRVVVRDRNAHAWVELWMPAQGWVRFDPTPRGDGVNPSAAGTLPFSLDRYLDPASEEEPGAERPEGPSVLPERPEPERFGEVDTGGAGARTGHGVPGWLGWAAAVAVLAAGTVPGLKWLRRRRRMLRLAGGDVGAAWEDLIDRLDDLGMGVPPAVTPVEVAASLGVEAAPLAGEYGRALYGDPALPAPGTVATATRSLEATRRSLAAGLSLRRRLAAVYRVGSLLPARLRAAMRRARRGA